MTVRTANFAFVDFCLDTFPRPTVARVARYVRELLADVIELKNHDVSLAAVNTRVLQEVVDDPLTHLSASLRDLTQPPRLLALMVLPVVPRIRLGKAVATPGLQLRLAASHRRERVQRFDLATLRARSHERERADTGASRE
jgi:hypothetical protein